MTVQATVNSVTYVGDGAQTVFNFDFRVDDIAWLSVDFTDDFDTFALNVDQDASPGGTATYLVAPPLDQELTIIRATPQSQELDYTRYDPFDSESHEFGLDKIVMMIQDLLGTVNAISQGLPAGTIEGQLLRWNDTTKEYEVAPLSALGDDDVTLENLVGKLFVNNAVTGGVKRQVGYNVMFPKLEDGAYAFDDLGNGALILNEDADTETWTIDQDADVDTGALYGLSNEGAGDLTLLVGTGVTAIHIAADGTRTTKAATESWVLETGFLGSLWKRSTTEFWWWGTSNIVA